MPLWDTANPQLKNLVAYEPGKPIDEVARELGLDPSQIVKLASNENPLGPSPKAKVAMAAAMDQAHIYPDGGGYRLRHAIAEKFGMNMKNVVLGNGSNEIIELIGHAFLRPGDEVVTAQHAFVVYKLMATLFGATTIEVPDPGFQHDLEAFGELGPADGCPAGGSVVTAAEFVFRVPSLGLAGGGPEFDLVLNPNSEVGDKIPG